MKAYERLLKYATIHTTSDDTTGTHPSTMRQLDLAKQLVEEMREIGMREVRISTYGYVYGCLPATPGYESSPRIGFVAHMDTSPDVCGASVKPQLINDYDGQPVVLQGTGQILSPDQFPHLLDMKGKTLITTDGRTLLGADDKAGIAEILTAIEQIVRKQIPHGKILVAFTPDEEIGQGADNFDIDGFGADFAYTLDGGVAGELEFENFNATEAKIHIKGVAVHPGTAKNVMVNALLLAFSFNQMTPLAETPEHTENYEGYYYLRKLEGTPESVSMIYALRDHDAGRLQLRKETLLHIAKTINEQVAADTVTVEIKDQYRNMSEIICEHDHLLQNAKTAMERSGITPIVQPMRGGTDGATLSYKGLPCPNLGVGGFAFHSPFEHISVEDMDRCTQMIIELVRLYAVQT